MAKVLSENCLSFARLIASGVSYSELKTDDGRNKDEVLREIAIELLLLEASHEDKSYAIEDVRKTHKNAYKPWTLSEENQLMSLLVDGHSVAQISETLDRQPGGIISRVRKIQAQREKD